jgi:deoxyribose-phosphate aldolase
LTLDLRRIQTWAARPADLPRRAAAILEAASPPPSADRLRTWIACLDLTSLRATEMPERIARLANRALGEGRLGGPVAAVCTYPVDCPTVRGVVGDTLHVAAVAGGFPAGRTPLSARVEEVRSALELGADEVDLAMRRDLALQRDWRALYDELRVLRTAADGARLKVILSTGDLDDPDLIAGAAWTALMAGADFLKTSTGYDTRGARLRDGLVITDVLRAWLVEGGRAVGFKAAGGLRTGADAAPWAALVERELGAEALRPDRFRLGASALLDALEETLAGA